MTTRRFNYTERKKLLREDVAIQLEPTRSGVAFEARLSLAGYGLPSDARIVIEAYKSPILMRFEYGTVGFPRRPASSDLSDFDPPDGVRFRVKVIGGDERAGRLLAVADQVTPQAPDARLATQVPLIITEGADLGELAWTLLVEAGPDLPRLRVNERLGDWRGIARGAQFTYLVYPELLRQILRFVLIEDAAWDDEDGDDWRTQWVRFSELLPGVSPAPEANDPEIDRQEWISSVVQSFCRVKSMRERFGALLSGGVE